MPETIKKNYVFWVLAALLVGGGVFHYYETQRLYQRMALLEEKNGKSQTDAERLFERFTELETEILDLKGSLEESQKETASLLSNLEELRSSIDEAVSEEVTHMPELESLEAKSRGVSSRLLGTQTNLKQTENQIRSWGNDVSAFRTQQYQQLYQQPRPVQQESVPAGASAICRDGTYSYSQNRRGTCSHHGGVAKWLY